MWPVVGVALLVVAASPARPSSKTNSVQVGRLGALRGQEMTLARTQRATAFLGTSYSMATAPRSDKTKGGRCGKRSLSHAFYILHENSLSYNQTRENDEAARLQGTQTAKESPSRFNENIAAVCKMKNGKAPEIYGMPAKKFKDDFGGLIKIGAGIPYAKAPIGSLRFKRPQTEPWPQWDGTRDATSFRPSCKQPMNKIEDGDKLGLVEKLQKPIEYSEDCLYLNIYVPDGE
ncbi:unnamed protein product [Nezara viridula]|uniref:Carboxylesterase type B domain-containing protein n=1 Tax=Nezara viridula TaxID=85310 RepID=A0A9P0E7C4_NEZVI|nr:unnamed protein product [Nezara viridula]